MASNPLINQGTLNRALVALQVVDSPGLNVTVGYFGSKMARMSFGGQASDYIPSQVGAVPSGRLYQIVDISLYLNKSQSLAAFWEQRRLTNTTLGNIVAFTDSNVMPQYLLYQCVLTNVESLEMTGESNDYPVNIQGYYPINNSLYG